MAVLQVPRQVPRLPSGIRVRILDQLTDQLAVGRIDPHRRARGQVDEMHGVLTRAVPLGGPVVRVRDHADPFQVGRRTRGRLHEDECVDGALHEVALEGADGVDGGDRVLRREPGEIRLVAL